MQEKEVPVWGYKVWPSDANYEQRTDRVNDFFELDEDQRKQVEHFF
jgi:hypothetical protein